MSEPILVTVSTEIDGCNVRVTQRYLETLNGGHLNWYIERDGHILTAGYSSGGIPHGKVDRERLRQIYREWKRFKRKESL
jgi:hypothetical protein